MPCEWYKSADGVVIHVNRGHSRSPQRICKFCRQKYRDGKLCDFPVEHGKTCDAEMCSDCARTLGPQETHIGHGIVRLGDTIDVCPIHRDQAVVQGGRILSKEKA
jgi:hypothetical protein